MNMETKPIVSKVRAIVQFGPATDMSGMRPAEYYQVTIDPNMVSPSGEFIRFGQFAGDELVGWQRVAAMTVSEVLCETNAEPINAEGYTKVDGAKVVMRILEL